MKWLFEKLNEAVKAHDRKIEEAFSDEAWHNKRHEEYQKGFENILKDAGWTRYDYLEEYDHQIGWDISAGHPSYFMSRAQCLSYGLSKLAEVDKECKFTSKKQYLLVKSLHFAEKLSERDKRDLARYGWTWHPGYDTFDIELY